MPVESPTVESAETASKARPKAGCFSNARRPRIETESRETEMMTVAKARWIEASPRRCR